MFSFTTRTKAVLLALAIFVLGMVCGAVVDRQIVLKRARSAAAWWQGRRGPRPEMKDRMLHRYERELGLTVEQKTQLGAILDTSRTQMGKIRESVRGDLDAVARDTRTRISELLTPEQQEKFKQFRERQRRERPRRRRPKPPPGP